MVKEKSLDIINANRGSFAVVSACMGFLLYYPLYFPVFVS